MSLSIFSLHIICFQSLSDEHLCKYHESLEEYPDVLHFIFQLDCKDFQNVHWEQLLMFLFSSFCETPFILMPGITYNCLDSKVLVK